MTIPVWLLIVVVWFAVSAWILWSADHPGSSWDFGVGALIGAALFVIWTLACGLLLALIY